MRIVRVFPRQTDMTPIDPYAFVGDPPFWRPEAAEVHVSVSFTWDKKEADRLAQAWGQYYPRVRMDGPAISGSNGIFVPGFYCRRGVTITSRGCNNLCPWCLVPEQEGMLKPLPIEPGYIVQDNNLLQTGRTHKEAVFAMLRKQRRGIKFVGGLEATLVNDWLVDELQGLQIEEVWLSADYDGALKPLARALNKLSFLPRRKLRCYVLLAYGGESMAKGEARLERVWELGALPFAQLYQPKDEWIEYSKDWQRLARKWSRPAAMFSSHLT